MPRDIEAVLTEPRLIERADKVIGYAEAHGWQATFERSAPGAIEGTGEAVMIGGVRTDLLPTGREVHFIFTIAFGINPDTGRVVTLRHAERNDAPFVIEIEGDRRYWRGPLKAWPRALADPAVWTGLTPPPGAP